GDLILAGANTFRGTLYVGTSATQNPTINGDTVNDFFGVSSEPGGIVTVGNSNALGTTGVSEKQTVTFSGTSGTFTLTFNGQTTSALAFNASSSDVQAALQALPTIGSGNVSVSAVGGGYTVTFTGALAGFDQPMLTATGSGGTTADVPQTQTIKVAGAQGT